MSIEPISIEEITALSAFSVFAEAVRIGSTTGKAIPKWDAEVIGDMGQIVDTRPAIDVIIADWPQIAQGETVLLRGETYRADQQQPLDSVITRVLLR